MQPKMFDGYPQGKTSRHILTAALFILLGMLLLRLAGRSWAPVWLPLETYRVLVPATLLVVVGRLLATDHLQISRTFSNRALFAVVFAVSLLFFQPHIDSDGDYFYGYLRSLLWDGDLNLSNEAAWYSTGWMHLNRGYEQVNPTTGYVYSGATIGAALFWFPFIIVAHPVALLLQAVGYPVAADGYDLVYRLAVSLGTWTYMVAGLWLCVRLMQTWFPPAVALVAVLGMYLASPQLCYGFHSGSFSHGISFFLMTVFFYLWVRRRKNSQIRDAALLGSVLGLACLVRPQNALWLAIPVLDGVLRNGISQDWKRKVPHLFAFGVFLVLAFLPQLVLWEVERGGIFSFPQGSKFVDPERWGQLRVLFDPLHGLFIWHPLHLVALIGLIGFMRKERALGALFLLGILLQIWINGSVEAWHAGGAFGQRRFESALPLFMVGLAFLVQWTCVERPLWALTVTALSCAVVWNFLLLAQVLEGPLYYSQGIDFGTIWSQQSSVAPERLEIWVSRSPLVRWMVLGIGEGRLDYVLAWLTLAAMITLLFLLTRRFAPALLALLLQRKRTAWILACVIPLFLTAVILFTDAAASRVPVAMLIHEGGLVTREMALRSPEKYQGGCASFRLGPGESVRFPLNPPVNARTLMLVGGQSVDSVPCDQPLLRIGTGSSEIDIPARSFPPQIPASVSLSHPPSTASVVRTSFPGWGGISPQYSYACRIPLGASQTLTELRFQNLSDRVTLAIDGIAFLPGLSQESESAALRIPGPQEQTSVSIRELANADYRHNPFSVHDRSALNFYPLLSGGVYESGGVCFRIAPSVDETERWSVLGIVHKTDTFTLPVVSARYDGISLAWAAWGTCKRGGYRMPSEQVAIVHLEYADGQQEEQEVRSHRDIFDWRDRFVPHDRLVYEEALYQKICRTDFPLTRPDVPLKAIHIEACWTTDGIGLALFAVTAWRNPGD
ncbi:MAG TPA: hypothetical protein PLY86_09060 [bacterium]|nr:hypothetical protein [bacterium]